MAWLPLLAVLLACGADGRRMPATNGGLEEGRPVALRWPALPEVELPQRPPGPAGPSQPAPRWQIFFELAHPDPAVRLDAIERARAFSKEPAMRARLLELLDDPDPEVAAAVMHRVDANDPEVHDRLFVVLRDRRGVARQLAAHYLLRTGRLRGRWQTFAQSVAYPERSPPRILVF